MDATRGGNLHCNLLSDRGKRVDDTRGGSLHWCPPGQRHALTTLRSRTFGMKSYPIPSTCTSHTSCHAAPARVSASARVSWDNIPVRGIVVLGACTIRYRMHWIHRRHRMKQMHRNKADPSCGPAPPYYPFTRGKSIPGVIYGVFCGLI